MPETEAPKKSTKATVRINRVDENTDEVFIYSEEPYVNRAIFAKAGVFKAGETTLEEFAAKEAQLKPQKGDPLLGAIQPAGAPAK